MIAGDHFVYLLAGHIYQAVFGEFENEALRVPAFTCEPGFAEIFKEKARFLFLPFRPLF